jgi:hypothetical protein
MALDAREFGPLNASELQNLGLSHAAAVDWHFAAPRIVPKLLATLIARDERIAELEQELFTLRDHLG